MLRKVHRAVMKPLGAITEFGIRQVPAPNQRAVVPILAHISEIQHFRIGKSVLITRGGDLTITRCDMESDQHSSVVVDHAGYLQRR
ncbi:MAG: hypothetical protein VYC44_02280 [Chloroflexota bacterium]|nr:hypothetical protein [Chloroflexota bacterium]